VIFRILLLIDREEFRGLNFQRGADFQNSSKCRAPLPVLDEADSGTVKAGELSEFFLRYGFGFSFVLEDFAKDLFFLRCHWRRC